MPRTKTTVNVLFGLLLLDSPVASRAQDQGSSSGDRESKAAPAVTFGIEYTQVNGRKEAGLQRYKSEAEARKAAERYMAAWNKPGVSTPDVYIKSYVITSDKSLVEKAMEARERGKEAIEQYKDVKERAKKLEEEGPKSLLPEAKERERGSTLKEYWGRLQKSYEEVKDAKARLISMNGNITRKQFDDVNRLIAGYNQSREEAGKVEAQSPAPGGSTRPGETVRLRSGGGLAAASILNRFPTVAPLAPKEFEGRLEPERPTGKYTVWVYKLTGGSWEKQEGRTLVTNDEAQASRYVVDVKAVQGWTATSNSRVSSSANSVAIENLEGSTWVDHKYERILKFEANAYDRPTAIPGKAFYQVGHDGKLFDNRMIMLGTWQQTGNTLTLFEPASSDGSRGSIFKGSISADSISGKRTDFDHSGDGPETLVRFRPK